MQPAKGHYDLWPHLQHVDIGYQKQIQLRQKETNEKHVGKNRLSWIHSEFERELPLFGSGQMRAADSTSVHPGCHKVRYWSPFCENNVKYSALASCSKKSTSWLLDKVKLSS